jgi:hypothetical protein
MSLLQFRRLQLFEFCDQAWLPAFIREAHLDCLNFIHTTYQPYFRLAGLIARWASQTGNAAVLDIGSGGAEQVARLIRCAIAQDVSLPRFVVSDLYPNIDAWRQVEGELGEQQLGHVEKPLSALNAQDSNLRNWSIFTAFHHLAPETARHFLANFAKHGNGLCIVELTKRRWLDIIPMIFALPVHLIVPFFAKKFKLSKLLVTTVLPIVPVMVSFDGVISVLRTYKPDEIVNMFPADLRDSFEVEHQEVWWRFAPSKATLLTFTRK